MKRILYFILTFVFVLTAGTSRVEAAQTYTDGYLEYQVRNNAAIICGYFGKETEVTVPASIAGHPVSEIAAGAFADADTVEKVNLPDTIMRIESGAFGRNQSVVYNSNTDKPTSTIPDEIESSEGSEGADGKGTTQSGSQTVGTAQSGDGNSAASGSGFGDGASASGVSGAGTTGAEADEVGADAEPRPGEDEQEVDLTMLDADGEDGAADKEAGDAKISVTVWIAVAVIVLAAVAAGGVLAARKARGIKHGEKRGKKRNEKRGGGHRGE